MNTNSSQVGRGFLFFLCIYLLPLALVGCGGDTESTPDASPPSESNSSGPASGEPIIIASVKGFTGFMADYDEPPTEGAELAIEDVNNAGGVLGRPLELIKIDMKTQVDEGRPAALEGLEQGASLIITSCDFETGAPAALTAQAEGVLTFSDCAGSVRFGPAGIGPLAYTLGLAAVSEGAAVAEWAYEKKGLRQAYVLVDTALTYNEESCRGFKERFEEFGGGTDEDTFQYGDTSISGQITRLQSASPAPDSIYICSSGGAPLREIRGAGIDLPILSNTSYDGDWWKKPVPGISDVYFNTYASLFGDDPSPETNAFFEQFQERTGSLPASSSALTGYSVIEAFRLAAEAAQSLDGSALATALDTMGEMDLLVGPTEFTSDLHLDLDRPMPIMQVQDGQTSFVETWTLSKPPTTEE